MLRRAPTATQSDLLRRRHLEIERRLAPYFAVLAGFGLCALVSAAFILPPVTVALAALGGVGAVVVRAWYAARLARTSRPVQLVMTEQMAVTTLLMGVLAATGGLAHSPIAPACALAMAMAGVRFTGRPLVIVAAFTMLGALAVTLAVDPHVLHRDPALLVVWEGTMVGIAVLTTIVAHSERSAHVEAVIDALTGLPNRKGLATFAEAHEADDAPNVATTVLACDVDHFKEINDEGGHERGDAALIAIADALRAAAGDAAGVFRLGGDEFLVVCRALRLDEGHAVAEALCEAVRQLDGAAARASLSVGIAHRERGRGALGALMREADEALYRAKVAGRDRVMQPRLAITG